MTRVWVWDAAAGGRSGSGACPEYAGAGARERAQAAAEEWMGAHGADEAMLELVELSTGMSGAYRSLPYRERLAGLRHPSGIITWAPPLGGASDAA